MSLSPLRKLLTMLASVIGLLLALIGVILLISGTHGYVSNDAVDELPFAQLLLAIGFLGIPACGLFLYRSHQSIQRGKNRYGLPDSPLHQLTLITLTITSALVTVAAFVIRIIVF
ncbi:MAG: hypothetical protein RRA94_06030 [Bacteroidota bacterium]|nr:hypothetical protein [Bacteroidota bacterium]